MRKPFSVVGCIVATLLSATASPGAAAQTVMKIAHLVPGEAPRGRGATETARLITDDASCEISAKLLILLNDRSWPKAAVR